MSNAALFMRTTADYGKIFGKYWNGIYAILSEGKHNNGTYSHAYASGAGSPAMDRSTYNDYPPNQARNPHPHTYPHSPTRYSIGHTHQPT